MNSFPSTGAGASPEYEMLEERPSTSANKHSDCMEPSNESFLSSEKLSRNMALRGWIRSRSSTVAAASRLLSCSELSRASPLSRVSRSTILACYYTLVPRLRQGRRSLEHLDAPTSQPAQLNNPVPASEAKPSTAPAETSVVQQPSTPAPGSHSAFTALGPRLSMSGRPLRIGEREISVSPECDWTAKWGWVLRLRAYSHPEHAHCSDWCINVEIFFQDLPLLLSLGGLVWESAHVDQSHFHHCINIVADRERPWVQSATYRTDIPGIGWRAEAVHRSRHQPVCRSDLTSLLSAETVYQAEIDQRTATGRAKRVMVYYPQIGYGNDITGQHLDVWHDGLLERPGQFIRPLMPVDPYCAEEGRNE